MMSSMPGIFSSGWMSTGMPRPSSETSQLPSGCSTTSMLLGMAGERFVDGVVDDFLRQMVRARGVGVHAWAAFDRIQAGEDFDIGGVVATAHADDGNQ